MGSWEQVLRAVGGSLSPTLLWQSPLDEGRRVYRLGDRILKVVLAETETTAALRNRTLREEGAILERLGDIEGVPRYLDYWTSNGSEILVTAAVDGVSWSASGRPLKKAFISFPQLLLILARVSLRGVAHGDCKPENVILDTSGHPWLIDFDQAFSTSVFRSFTANFLGLGIPGVKNHGGVLQFIKQILKSILPSPVLRLARRVRRRIAGGQGPTFTALPALPSTASPRLRLLHRAWRLAAKSDANAPGQEVSYYSMIVEGMVLPGERPWDERWSVFRKAVKWSEGRVLELGCNLGLLSTFAKLSGAKDALGVDCDKTILEANRLVQTAYGVQYETMQLNFDDARNWEDDLQAFHPTVVTALSVLNWVRDKDRLLAFLGRFDQLLFEGHDPDDVEHQRLSSLGFTRIEVLTRSERGRVVFLASRTN